MTCNVSEHAVRLDDEQYEDFLIRLRARFDAATAGGARLFTTDAAGLFDTFLNALPESRRRHYTCNACRRFVDRFGGLVTISSDGAATSVLWDPETAPTFFKASVRALQRAVARAKVAGVFFCEDVTWGLTSNKSSKLPGIWHHMAVAPERSIIFKPVPLQYASQAMADKVQEYEMLCRGLGEFPIGVVAQAHTLLTSGNLYRSEKCIGAAKWLLELHEARNEPKNRRVRDNITWLAVATAPAGFCHVRSSMIGTLLDDIAAGMQFDDIKRRFDEKMNPLQYQRPQTAPSAGNIAQAEKIVAALRAAGALERRFAKLDDIQSLWKPTAAKPEPAKNGGGVFTHLKPKDVSSTPQIEQPTVVMTWEKFARTVLPDASEIEFLVPTTTAPYAAMVTAANADAPPILQWDREGKRNPVSWYLYINGSLPAAWNLKGGAYQRVTAVALQPSMWDPEAALSHQGASVFFVLDGARDLNYKRGAGFFPETLRSEYHGIRKTMEAYARIAVVVGADDAEACGVKLEKGSTWDQAFRVTSKNGRASYRLDRWD